MPYHKPILKVLFKFLQLGCIESFCQKPSDSSPIQTLHLIIATSCILAFLHKFSLQFGPFLLNFLAKNRKKSSTLWPICNCLSTLSFISFMKKNCKNAYSIWYSRRLEMLIWYSLKLYQHFTRPKKRLKSFP